MKHPEWKRAGLAALFLLAAADAWAGAAGKRIEILSGPTNDRYIGAYTSALTAEATKRGMEVSVTVGLKAGSAKGEVIVVGGNCQETGIRNIRSGSQAATINAPIPSIEAPQAAAEIEAFFEGRKLEKRKILPAEIITRANLESYVAACLY